MFVIHLITVLAVNLLAVEATINVCIPLHLGISTNVSTDQLCQEVKKDVAQRLAAEEDATDIFFEHLDIIFNHAALDLYAKLDNVTVKNVLNFNIDFLQNIFVNSTYYQFDIFNLTFPYIRLEGAYNLGEDSNLGDIFDIYGIGDFWLELIDTSIAVNAVKFQVDEDICIPVNINFHIQGIENRFANIMGDDDLEDLMTGLITNIGPEALEIVWNELREVFDKPLEDLINKILHGQNIFSLLNMVQGGEAEITGCSSN